MTTVSLRNFDLDTKTGKLFKALVLDREALTEAQITKRFGIKNPRATISDIRQRGFVIYANNRRAGNGVNVTEYTHGEMSRRMTAEYYQMRSMNRLVG